MRRQGNRPPPRTFLIANVQSVKGRHIFQAPSIESQHLDEKPPMRRTVIPPAAPPVQRGIVGHVGEDGGAGPVHFSNARFGRPPVFFPGKRPANREDPFQPGAKTSQREHQAPPKDTPVQVGVGVHQPGEQCGIPVITDASAGGKEGSNVLEGPRRPDGFPFHQDRSVFQGRTAPGEQPAGPVQHRRRRLTHLIVLHNHW